MRGFKLSIVCCAAMFAASSNAITISQNELNRMQTYAEKHGTVPVVVHLFALDLKNLPNEKSRINERSRQLEEDFLKEVGSGAIPNGRSTNGYGQLTVHLNTSGVQKLAKSRVALSAWQSEDWIESSRLDNSDGALDAIDQAFQKSQRVQIDIIPDIDDLSYSISSSGQVNIATSPSTEAAILSAKNSISAVLQSSNDASVSKASPERFLKSEKPGVIRLEVSRVELIDLITQKRIRNVRLANYTGSITTTYDKDLEGLLQKNGKVTAIFTLNNALGVGGKARNANARTLDANIDAIGQVATRWFPNKIPTQIWPQIGAFSMEIDSSDLARIKSTSDKRIIRVDANKPVLNLALATSSSMMQLQNAWNAGVTGVGQTIFVLDAGVQKNHPFLKDAVGNSRVTSEACFGTNDPGLGYVSVCEQPDGLGDSPPNLPGSGDIFNASDCPTIGGCDHGTHVAGIAAGRSEPNAPAGVKGVAYGANIGSLRISSVPVNKMNPLRGYQADITSAMELLMRLANPSPEGSVLPYVVNISQSTGWNGFPCGDESIYPDFKKAVNALELRGVPVIAGTGNEGKNFAIGWPSCVPGVIAAGAVNNDGPTPAFGRTTWRGIDGTTPFGTNMVNPRWFPTKAFFMAPGAPVVSSVPGGYGAMSGTSMATPQVAGLYALVKSFDPTLNNTQVTNLIRGAASQTTFTDTVCDNGNPPPAINNCTSETFYRIQMP